VLDAAGITQVVDLPGVGTNLLEHIYIASSYELSDRDKGQETWDHLRNPSFAEIQMKLHTGESHNRGMFSFSSLDSRTWDSTTFSAPRKSRSCSRTSTRRTRRAGRRA